MSLNLEASVRIPASLPHRCASPTDRKPQVRGPLFQRFASQISVDRWRGKSSETPAQPPGSCPKGRAEEEEGGGVRPHGCDPPRARPSHRPPWLSQHRHGHRTLGHTPRERRGPLGPAGSKERGLVYKLLGSHAAWGVGAVSEIIRGDDIKTRGHLTSAQEQPVLGGPRPRGGGRGAEKPCATRPRRHPW